jgi:hypothetical protein
MLSGNYDPLWKQARRIRPSRKVAVFESGNPAAKILKPPEVPGRFSYLAASRGARDSAGSLPASSKGLQDLTSRLVQRVANIGLVLLILKIVCSWNCRKARVFQCGQLGTRCRGRRGKFWWRVSLSDIAHAHELVEHPVRRGRVVVTV